MKLENYREKGVIGMREDQDSRFWYDRLASTFFAARLAAEFHQLDAPPVWAIRQKAADLRKAADLVDYLCDRLEADQEK